MKIKILTRIFILLATLFFSLACKQKNQQHSEISSMSTDYRNDCDTLKGFTNSLNCNVESF
jgi:hypothetical protein